MPHRRAGRSARQIMDGSVRHRRTNSDTIAFASVSDVAQSWEPTGPGVLALPSGRLVRGRALRRPVPRGNQPDFGLYLLGSRPPAIPWESRCLRWPDFWLPLDGTDARDALMELWHRAGGERVEVACGGGRGRTGTALACLAVLDGLSATEAVAYVRRRYHRRAVETPWQRRYVARFRAGDLS